jgi:transcriptional antiterminator RfaH
VTQSAAALALLEDPVWFCLRAEPKREHLAGMALRRQFGIDCLSPRLRFRRLTRRGPIWFVEAMFPGYVFAKFAYTSLYRAVQSSHGVRGILRFGEGLATVPENTMMALQARGGAEEIVTIDSSLKIGQPVQFIEGPLQGLEVVITQLLPARERIRVLLEFLGRSMEMEVPAGKVLPA